MAENLVLERERLRALANEISELHGSLSFTDEVPDPLTFLREHVLQSRPLVIRAGSGLIDGWPAMSGDTCWATPDLARLKELIGNKLLSVEAAPVGLGDCITEEGLFVMPESQRMTFDDFVERSKSSRDSGTTLYISHQNDNLREEGEALPLMADVGEHIPFALAALGTKPDAVNVWIGGDDATSSLHKDNYENFVCCLGGTKTFRLLHPWSSPFLYEKTVDAGHFYQDNRSGEFGIKMTGEKTAWTCVDVLHPDLKKFPLFREAKPLDVTLHKGDCLYLPALWYHAVHQKHRDEDGDWTMCVVSNICPARVVAQARAPSTCSVSPTPNRVSSEFLARHGLRIWPLPLPRILPVSLQGCGAL